VLDPLAQPTGGRKVPHWRMTLILTAQRCRETNALDSDSDSDFTISQAPRPVIPTSDLPALALRKGRRYRRTTDQTDRECAGAGCAGVNSGLQSISGRSVAEVQRRRGNSGRHSQMTGSRQRAGQLSGIQREAGETRTGGRICLTRSCVYCSARALDER
jgi:hypothetical protein